MPHRDLNSVAQVLSDFVASENSCSLAASHLAKDVEIGISIAGSLDCAFFKSPTGAAIEVRKPKNPDVIFTLTVETIDALVLEKGRSLGELGVAVLKQYVSGGVKIRVTGGLFSIMKNGYLGMIKDAGAPFARFIADYGVTNLAKIPDIIKKLRRP